MTKESRISLLTPEQIVALTIWGEARGATSMLRDGIGSVIQNRVRAQQRHWGLTPQAVCLSAGQFSCWTAFGGEHNFTEVMDAVVNTVEHQKSPGPILQECFRLAWNITGNILDDCTGGAVYYYSPRAMKPPGRIPHWANGRTPTVVIDGTAFFAEAA